MARPAPHNVVQTELADQAKRLYRTLGRNHKTNFRADALARDFVVQRLTHSGVSYSAQKRVVHAKVETARKADSTESSQRVVQQRRERRKRRADDAKPQVAQPSIRKILEQARVDVVKAGIDREIAAQRVFQRSANLDSGRDARVCGVLLCAKVHQVDPVSKNHHTRGFQMLRLLRIPLNDANRVVLFVLLLEPRVHELCKLASKHRVQRNVDVNFSHLVELSERNQHLVTHPAARNAQRELQIVRAHHLQQRIKHFCFSFGQRDFRRFRLNVGQNSALRCALLRLRSIWRGSR
mmetsp:Transcript_13694/g.36768  ORF Transcript_13694/g.36768 Transcript_13694/m.36768 type:complete len:294 (+) Transcript_13694:1701-2582(+)